MADFKPNPGSFLPLLESSRYRSASTRTAPASPITLLEILAGQTDFSLPLFDLRTRASMEPARYGESLKSLRDAGYIEIDGDAPDQIVHLTGRGAEVVRLARPA
jgi:DNA-binding MarR family transcriptional regulator